MGSMTTTMMTTHTRRLVLFDTVEMVRDGSLVFLFVGRFGRKKQGKASNGG